MYIYMCVCNTYISYIEVLKGSHKAGRIEHKRVGGQTGADMERVEYLMKVYNMFKLKV